jgi:hypothetical protein
VPARTSHHLWSGSLLLGTPALLSLGASMDAPRRCPRCSSDEVIRILYGTPSPDLLEEARAGRVALGGDVFWPEATVCPRVARRRGGIGTSHVNFTHYRGENPSPILPDMKVCKMCRSADVPTLGVTYSSARGRANPPPLWIRAHLTGCVCPPHRAWRGLCCVPVL